MNDYIAPVVETLTEDEVDRMAAILVEDLGVDPVLAERWVTYADSACKFLGQEEAWATALASTPSATKRAWNGDLEKRRGFQQAAIEMLKHWHRMGRPGQITFSRETSKHVGGHVPGLHQATHGPQQKVADLLNGYPIHVLPLIEEVLTVLAEVAGGEPMEQAMKRPPTMAKLRRESQVFFLTVLLEHSLMDGVHLDGDDGGKVAELCRVALTAHNRARGWDKPTSFKRLYGTAMQAASMA